MDKLMEHLEKSSPALRDRRLLPGWVMGFRQDAPRAWRAAAPFRLPGHSREGILQAMDRLLSYDRFDRGAGPDYIGGRIAARLERSYGRNEGWLATVDGLLSERLLLRFELEARVDEGGGVALRVSHDLPSWVDEFAARLRHELGPAGDGGDVVLGPGERLRRPYSGRLLDYSGCATLDEVDDLVKRPGDDKVLPLGAYAFDGRPDITGPRPPVLFLSRYRNRGLMAYNGTLVVAPQNAGKTELIVRWALAANRGNYSILVVDVKGSLFDRLMKEGLRGRVFHFSTSPDPRRGSRTLNFLEGLDPFTPLGRLEIANVIELLLPREVYGQGEDTRYWKIELKWLAAFIGLRKLHDRYFGSASDLSDVYDLAADERQLYQFCRRVLGAEAHHQRENPGLPPLQPGAAHWLLELAALIGQDAEGVPGGQREAKYTYPTLTINLTTALQPFSRFGTLYAQTSGRGDFTLRDLDGEEQTTIVLAAREQDGEASRAVVSMAIKRLEQILYDRRERRVAGDAPSHDVLLLLDETRRIRGFEAGRYITFARDAMAGCVLVYQSITQIPSEKEIVEILENVGTQIYLGSVTGETARRLIDLLPEHDRPRYSVGAGGAQVSQERVKCFSSSELYRLPAGTYPALVYIKDHGPGKPFLVAMDQDLLAECLESSPAGALNRRNRHGEEEARPGRDLGAV